MLGWQPLPVYADHEYVTMSGQKKAGDSRPGSLDETQATLEVEPATERAGRNQSTTTEHHESAWFRR